MVVLLYRVSHCMFSSHYHYNMHLLIPVRLLVALFHLIDYAVVPYRMLFP